MYLLRKLLRKLSLKPISVVFFSSQNVFLMKKNYIFGCNDSRCWCSGSSEIPEKCSQWEGDASRTKVITQFCLFVF